ncbi:MAG: hypothetical protein GX308_10085 [Epulopiscium sp.]|nr:hypothetical protein [Candidatus Epulonipiscium sp.]
MAEIFPVISTTDNVRATVAIPVPYEDNGTKVSNDTYEVFVNDDKIGEKVLLTQTDDPEDINGYLENNGFNNFKVNVLGDSIVIETNERPHKMKEILSSYLNTR